MKVQLSLENIGVTELNHMQSDLMCHVNSTKDTILLSSTGSGKTLGYCLLIQNHLLRNKDTQVLIIVPTRELAIQTENVLKKVFPDIFSTCVYGGHDTQIEKRRLYENPVIVVGTPGRIIHHLNDKNLNTDSLHTVILDEYDKSLELGFKEQIEEIMDCIENNTRKILISATELKVTPQFLQEEQYTKFNYLDSDITQSSLSLKVARTDSKNKFHTLLNILSKYIEHKTLVFCNHRDAVSRISEYLDNIPVHHDVFHGGMDQSERELTLIKFRNNSNRVLITTDLAARGLDIPAIDLIIHYQTPPKVESFIHRNGRTARMNSDGHAVIILAPDEQPEYLDSTIAVEDLEVKQVPPFTTPEYCTLRLNLGKKDKIRKMDIAGFFHSFDGVTQSDLGLIDVKDKESYIAVKYETGGLLLKVADRQKIKGKTVRIYRV